MMHYVSACWNCPLRKGKKCTEGPDHIPDGCMKSLTTAPKHRLYETTHAVPKECPLLYAAHVMGVALSRRWQSPCGDCDFVYMGKDAPVGKRFVWLYEWEKQHYGKSLARKPIFGKEKR